WCSPAIRSSWCGPARRRAGEEPKPRVRKNAPGARRPPSGTDHGSVTARRAVPGGAGAGLRASDGAAGVFENLDGPVDAVLAGDDGDDPARPAPGPTGVFTGQAL